MKLKNMKKVFLIKSINKKIKNKQEIKNNIKILNISIMCVFFIF